MKAVTQSNFPKETYNPATYLNPFGDQKAARSATSQRAGSGLTVTSLHGAKLVNRKEHILQGFHTSKNSQINAQKLSRDDFANRLYKN